MLCCAGKISLLLKISRIVISTILYTHNDEQISVKTFKILRKLDFKIDQLVSFFIKTFLKLKQYFLCLPSWEKNQPQTFSSTTFFLSRRIRFERRRHKQKAFQVIIIFFSLLSLPLHASWDPQWCDCKNEKDGNEAKPLSLHLWLFYSKKHFPSFNVRSFLFPT